MKKILVAAVLLIGCISASAQNFSVGGGFMNASTNFESGDPTTFNGGYLQLTAEQNFSSTFGVVAGIRYAYTGGENTTTVPIIGYKLEGKTANHSLGIPVFAKINFLNTGDLKVFAFAGPTLYYGLSSKSSLNGTVLTDYYDGNIYKPLNVTVGGGIGIDAMEVIRFTLGYDYGVTNKFDSDNLTAHTGDFRFGVAYLF